MMKPLRKLLIGAAILNFFSLVGKADVSVGRGCTTAFWIDEDCDGFVVGAKNPVVRSAQIPVPTPPNLDPDANDRMTSINTAASAEAHYGSFANIQNFKNYLADLGYTHAINNVYFISPTGNDGTAVINDVNFPFRNRPRPHCTQGCCTGSCIIGPGDVVVYRGGSYPEGLDTQANGYPLWEGMKGTAERPILLINYPGERAIFYTSNGGFMWNDGDTTTIDDSGIKNMVFQNNILWSKQGFNGFENASYAAIRIDRHTPQRPYENIRFYNNIIYPQGAIPIEIMQIDNVQNITMENNIFYRGNGAINTNTMMSCQGTDGSHTSVNSESMGICPGPAYFWTFQAMQDPVRRPQITNNMFADPQFADVTNNYASGLTPGMFDFAPTQNSPTIDFAHPGYASATDLRRNSRVGPADAGAYEYSLASANNPPTVEAGLDQQIVWPTSQVSLSGIASDDGLPNPPAQMFLQWTRASGPGNIVFSNPTSRDTTATFSQPGTYSLRFSATDGAIFRSDLLQVTVQGLGGAGAGADSGTAEFVPCAGPMSLSREGNIPVCFNLPIEKKATVQIFTRNGQKTRDLVNDVRPSGFNMLLWDGKSDGGQQATSGTYTAVLKVDGEKPKRQKVVVIL